MMSFCIEEAGAGGKKRDQDKGLSSLSEIKKDCASWFLSLLLVIYVALPFRCY